MGCGLMEILYVELWSMIKMFKSVFQSVRSKFLGILDEFGSASIVDQDGEGIRRCQI